MTSDQTAEGAGLSLALHTVIAGLVAAWVILAAMREPPAPVVFEMLPPPARSSPAPAADPRLDVAAPDLPELPAYSPPAPRPTPDSVRPTPRPTPPTPAPTPSRVTEPARPAPTPALTYEQYLQSQQRPARPTPARTPAPAVQAPRINTDRIRRSLEELGATTADPSLLASTTAAEMTAIQAYLARLAATLRAQWRQPEGLDAGLEAAVTFDIAADGTFVRPTLSRRSGRADFDASVLDVLQRLGRFDPPPGGRAIPAVTAPFRTES